MKLGITTPVVTNVGGAELGWEAHAAIEDIGRIAETADRLGYHHMTCSQHIGLPSTEIGLTDTRRTPDLSDCRAPCANIARTDRDIAALRDQAAHLTEFTSDPMVPGQRTIRYRHELDRLRTLIDEHDHGRPTSP